MTVRAVRSIRSSPLPTLVGAPATRRTLPPFALMSMRKNVTPCRLAATWTLLMHSSTASATAPGPDCPRMASVPENSMNATEMYRCSGSGDPWSRYSRIPIGRHAARSTPVASASGANPTRSPSGAPASRNASSLGSPTTLGSSRAAVAGLIATSPAAAMDSIRAVVVAPGPAMTSSWWRSPARKKWKVPLWIPTDMRSRTAPAEVRSRPMRRIVRCMPIAARHARAAWSSPSKRSRTASPPHLMRPAPSS